jgi:hypothetical protein
MNWWNCNCYRYDSICTYIMAKLLDVIMAIHGLGFSVHLRGTNIMAHFREVIHMQSFWEVFTPQRKLGLIVGCKLRA